MSCAVIVKRSYKIIFSQRHPRTTVLVTVFLLSRSEASSSGPPSNASTWYSVFLLSRTGYQ